MITLVLHSYHLRVMGKISGGVITREIQDVIYILNAHTLIYIIIPHSLHDLF